MISCVRAADPTDIPWLLEQLRQFDTFFAGGRPMMPDDAAARAKLTMLIDEHVFLIAQNDVRTGFIAGLFAPHFFNDEPTLTEVLWWVPPAFRGSSTGGRLLLAFEDEARKLGASQVVMTLEHRTITDKLIDPRSLTARGYVEKERSYLLELPGVTP